METTPEPARVLVVDDAELNHAILAKFLAKWGCLVDCASNGREAVALAANSSYRLVLMDCNMPVMDGFEATEAIRSHEALTGEHVPIVAITGTPHEHERQRCFEVGMDAFFPKPIDSDDLYRIVSKYVWKKDVSLAGREKDR